MKTLDVKEIITNLGLEDAICKAFAEATGKSQKEFHLLFNNIVEKEINSIGDSLTTGEVNEASFSRLRGLSLQDFMKDNDKIIKDK